MDGINFMILPQSVFPSSASQGALAIECKTNRSDHSELLNKLKLAEDKKTKEEVRLSHFGSSVPSEETLHHKAAELIQDKKVEEALALLMG